MKQYHYYLLFTILLFTISTIIVVSINFFKEQYPLHTAVYNCDYWLVNSLIEDGFDVNQHTSEDKIILNRHWRFKNKFPYIYIKTKYRKTYKGTPLHILASVVNPDTRKKVKIAKLLIEHGADVNSYDATGRTPLDINVYGNELNLVFIKNGADPFLGYESLLIPSLNKCYCQSLIEILISYKNIFMLKKVLEIDNSKINHLYSNYYDKKPYTLMDKALESKDKKIIQLMRSYGAKTSDELYNQWVQEKKHEESN